MEIVFYSTGCPRCKVLKRKLEESGITYVENNSVDEMLSLGIRQVPVLKVEDVMMNYTEALKWADRHKEVV